MSISQLGDLANSGMLLAGMGWAAYQLRGIASWLTSAAKRSVVSTLTVTDENPSFTPLLGWLSRRAKRHRDVQPGLVTGSDVRVAPGQSWLWDRGRPVFVNYFRADTASGSRYAPAERLTLTFLTRDSNHLESVVREAESEAIRPDSIRIMFQNGYSWVSHVIPARPWETISLQSGVADDLLRDAERFFSSACWYTERGIPYRRGYLLEGPPGTGKTSVAIALATRLKRPLAMFQLSEAKDSSLSTLSRNIEPGSILLFEDVDCAGVTVDRRRRPVSSGENEDPADDGFGGVTLSGLLNAIDGVAAPVGCLTIFTTNHPERLDPAILRPGRVDRRLKLGHVTMCQAMAMFARFFPAQDGARFCETMVSSHATPASVQQELMLMASVGGLS